MDMNSLISTYTNNEYTFDTLKDNKDAICELVSKGLLRLMVTEVINYKRANNQFSKFKQRRSYSGKIINNIYVNPATGETLNVDGLTKLFDVAPADVKSAVRKHTDNKSYSVTYNKDELFKAFASEEALLQFINEIINSLYNGSEIHDKDEFLSLFSDMYNNNLCRVVTTSAVDASNISEFAVTLKTYVESFKQESNKYNVWKRLNPHDTSAVFWSLPEDINIILPIGVAARLDVQLLAQMFNIERAEVDGRIYTVDADKLPSGVQAIIFDSTLVKIDEIFAELEPTFYDSSVRRYKEIYNTSEEYGINPFANCVVLATAAASVPATAVRSQTVNVTSGVKKTIALEVVPVGANATIVAVPGKVTTTAAIAYDALTGWSLDITATADDTITFTVGGDAIDGTITVDVA